MPYSKHIPRVFTDDEISLIVDYILHSEEHLPTNSGEMLRWRDLTAIELMYFCGLRPAECLQLKWLDIDFEKDLIYVRPYLNHKRKNDLPAILTPPAKRILFRYKEKLNELKVNNEWCFPSFWSWNPIATGSMNRIFLNVCKKLGLAKIEGRRESGQPKYSVSLYCLRHSFCTKVYIATGSDIAVMNMARHTKVESAHIYTHLDFEYKKKLAIKVFGNAV
jgi:integrase